MKKQILIVLLFFITPFIFAQSFSENKLKAEQGDAVAQYDLAYSYYKGEGTTVDKKKHTVGF